MKNRLTNLAYISFIFISIMFTVPNVVLIEISKVFQVETYKIGYALTFFTIGTSSAAFLSGYILKYIDFKKLLYSAYGLICSGLIGIFFSKTLLFYEIFLLISGFGIGILIATSNYMLVKLYDNNERRFKISMLNFFYGFGSIICPLIISQLLLFNLGWQQFYLILILFVIGFSITLFFSDTSIVQHEDIPQEKKEGHFSLIIILIGLSMFFYVISEVVFTTWIVTYMRESLLWNLDMAGKILSFFWIFMAAGRLLSGFLAEKIKLELYIITSMISSLVLVFMFLSFKTSISLFVVASITGLAYSALYPSILTFGTSQIKNIPPHMVTFFITMGAAGSLASFPISGFIKHSLSVKHVIASSMIFMSLAIICIIPVLLRKRFIIKNIFISHE